jgi:hypothetical protein
MIVRRIRMSVDIWFLEVRSLESGTTIPVTIEGRSAPDIYQDLAAPETTPNDDNVAWNAFDICSIGILQQNIIRIYATSNRKLKKRQTRGTGRNK